MSHDFLGLPDTDISLLLIAAALLDDEEKEKTQRQEQKLKDEADKASKHIEIRLAPPPISSRGRRRL